MRWRCWHGVGCHHFWKAQRPIWNYDHSQRICKQLTKESKQGKVIDRIFRHKPASILTLVEQQGIRSFYSRVVVVLMEVSS